MKILHIIFSLNTGGVETMLVDLVNEQSKYINVDVIIINNSVNENLLKSINSQIRVHLINRPPGSRNIFKALKLNYLVFNIHPDVIHFHNHNAINLIKYRTAVTCLTLHTVNIPGCNLLKYQKLFSISESVKSDVFARCSAGSTRVYNGIDFSRIAFKRQFYKNDQFRLVQVSRLDHEVKGQHILLKALHDLVYKYNHQNLELDFIGEGDSMQYLQEYTKQCGLEKNVKFLGEKDRAYIYENLQNYEVLIQPSIIEGFGLTIVEGIAAGLPVVISNVKGPLEIINRMSKGWIFHQEDANSLCDQILKILDLYKKNRIEPISIKNLLIAKKYFSIEKTSRDYVDNYNNMILLSGT